MTQQAYAKRISDLWAKLAEASPDLWKEHLALQREYQASQPKTWDAEGDIATQLHSLKCAIVSRDHKVSLLTAMVGLPLTPGARLLP
jgi:hypothetical protein